MTKPILIALLLMLLYIFVETKILSFILLWDKSHVYVTIVWGLTVAAVMMLDISRVSTKTDFFKKEALSNLRITAAVDFLVNFYVFSLPVELLLVPFTTIVMTLHAVIEKKEQYKQAETILNRILVMLGLTVAVYVGYSIYIDFNKFARIETLKDFAVPLALSLLFLPFIYLLVAYLQYERLWLRLPYFIKSSELCRYTRRRLLLTYHLKINALEAWARRLPCLELQSQSDVLNSFSETGEVLTSEPPNGFRSLIWGAQPQEDMKRIAESTSDDTTMYVSVSDKPLPPLMGIPVAEETYQFTKGKFFCATVWLVGIDNYEKIRKVLPRTYGAPSFINERLNLWKWKWPKKQIEVHLSFESRLSRTQVTFLNNAV